MCDDILKEEGICEKHHLPSYYSTILQEWVCDECIRELREFDDIDNE